MTLKSLPVGRVADIVHEALRAPASAGLETVYLIFSLALTTCCESPLGGVVCPGFSSQIVAKVCVRLAEASKVASM